MRPSVQQHISKDKNVMARANKYYLKNNYLTLGQRSRSHEGHYGTRHTPYGHAPKYQISWTYLERQKCYGLDKKILFKKTSFDLEVKVPRRSLRYATPSYGHAPTYQISLTYLQRNNYLTLKSKVKVSQRSLQYATHRLMVMHPHTKYH